MVLQQRLARSCELEHEQPVAVLRRQRQAGNAARRPRPGVCSRSSRSTRRSVRRPLDDAGRPRAPLRANRGSDDLPRHSEPDHQRRHALKARARRTSAAQDDDEKRSAAAAKLPLCARRAALLLCPSRLPLLVRLGSWQCRGRLRAILHEATPCETLAAADPRVGRCPSARRQPTSV